jgi:tetratricopeptide (TPR) repeat protein
LFAELARDYPDEPEYSGRLVRTCNSLGRSYDLFGRRPEAEKMYQTGREAHARWVAQHPADALHRESFGWLCANLAALYRRTQRVEAALPPAQESIAAAEQLVNDHPGDTTYRQLLYHALCELGWCHVQLAQLEPAQTAWDRAVAVAQRLAGDHPGNGEFREAQANALQGRATVWYDLANRPEPAAVALRAALGIRERLVAEAPEVGPYRATLWATTLELADLLRDRGRLSERLDLLTHAMALWDRDRIPTSDRSAYLGGLHAERGLTQAYLGRAAEARQDFGRASALSPAKDQPDVHVRRELAEAVLLLKHGQPRQAAEKIMAVRRAQTLDGKRLVLAASILSQAVDALQHDTQLPVAERAGQVRHYAAEGTALLIAAQAAGYFDRAGRRVRLQASPEFAVLRQHGDPAELERLLTSRNGAMP